MECIRSRERAGWGGGEWWWFEGEGMVGKDTSAEIIFTVAFQCVFLLEIKKCGAVSKSYAGLK